jgi:hypothetical protein
MRSDNKVRELATVCLPWQQCEQKPQYGLMTSAYSVPSCSMTVSFRMASIIICVCFGVLYYYKIN